MLSSQSPTSVPSSSSSSHQPSPLHLHTMSPSPLHQSPKPTSQYNQRLSAVFNKDRTQSSKFVYAIKPSNIYCRPDCEITKPIDQSSAIFFDSSRDASSNGFKPCNHCQPELEMKVDNSVIDSTVNAVNASLGLDLGQSNPSKTSGISIPTTTSSVPKSDPNKNSIPGSISYVLPSDQSPTPEFSPTRHFRSLSSVGNQEFMMPTVVDREGWRPRRASIASGHIPAVLAAVTEMTKTEGEMGANIVLPDSSLTSQSNSHSHPGRRRDRSDGGERDHHKLVDEACRHIAAAAAASAAAAAAAAVANSEDETTTTPSSSRSRSRKGHAAGPGRSASNSISGASATQAIRLQRKKRRGGILGFKELAAKAGLSPWHFHRVFRSVTGLTPKAYGEACWNAVTANPTVPVEIMTNANASKSNDDPSKKNYNQTITPLTQTQTQFFNQPFQIPMLDYQFHSTTSEPGDINSMDVTPNLLGFDLMNSRTNPLNANSLDQMDPLDTLGAPTYKGHGHFVMPTTNAGPLLTNRTVTTINDPTPLIPTTANSWEGMMPMGYMQDSPSISSAGGTESGTPTTLHSSNGTPLNSYHQIHKQQLHNLQPPQQTQMAWVDENKSFDSSLPLHPVVATAPTHTSTSSLLSSPPSSMGLGNSFSDLSVNDIFTTMESTPTILSASTTNVLMDSQFPVVNSAQVDVDSMPSFNSEANWLVDTSNFFSENEDAALKKHKMQLEIQY